jgi:acyl-CoA synthetase (AMP-forming)/AMP-acid ligase II
MIIFTSGTTKAPKGVLNSHGRLMLLGWGAAVHMCQFQPDDCVYCAMPLFHATAQILALVPALSAGGCSGGRAVVAQRTGDLLIDSCNRIVCTSEAAAATHGAR